MSAGSWRSMNEQELTELFRKIGAQQPEIWARSQIERGIVHFPRDLFLNLAVGDATQPDDRSWLTKMRSRKPNDPGGEFGPAIDRLLAAGARADDLTTIVGIMQMSLLVDLCALLDDPGELEPEVSDIRWRLFQCAENGAPEAPISGLAETFYETGPTEAKARPFWRDETKSSAANAGNWRSMSEQELTELFRKLGADGPEGWAHSQITEGIPQLLRYLFLRQASSKVIGPDDRDWMTEIFEEKPEDEAEFDQAINAVLATGARAEDLATIVRIMQWFLLFSFCVLLDDGLLFRVDGRHVPLRELTGFRWCLFQVDENDAPVVPIDGLHESVPEIDPAGREMRASVGGHVIHR